MSRRPQTVTRLHPWTKQSQDLPVSLEQIAAAFHQLDDLWSCIELNTRDPCWSEREWKMACARLWARLPRARQSLEELDGIQADRWPDTDWAVRLSTARDEAERQLLDLGSSMSSIIRGETGTADAVVSFSFDCAKIGRTIGELCGLIVKQYPEAIGEI